MKQGPRWFINLFTWFVNGIKMATDVIYFAVFAIGNFVYIYKVFVKIILYEILSLKKGGELTQR